MSLTIDTRGMRCPWPVLRAAKAMRDSAETTILVDDPSAPEQIAILASAHGWEYRRVAAECVRLSRSPR